MTHSDEHVARLEAQAEHAAREKRQLLAIIAQVRTALGTPDGVDVTHHAAQVVAEAQRARDDLAQAQLQSNAYKDGMEQLARFINAVTVAVHVPDDATGDKYFDLLNGIAADAAKWRAVPWETMDTLIYYGQHGFNFDDELNDLQQWWLMNAPEEARG